MLALDENALICDLAETYQLYDYRSLPVFTVAALSAGLRDNSRIMTIMRGGALTSNEYILAMVYDLLAMRFTDGKAKVHLYDELYGSIKPRQEPKKKMRSYDSPEDFEQARRKAIGMD